MKRTSAIAAVTAAALALSLAACGSADSAAASSAPAGDFDADQDITVISREDGADFTSAQPEGKIVVGGSSSVSPLMEKLIEAYKTVNPNAELELQTTDSTTGVSGALEGTYTIGMASRELKDSEVEGGAKATVLALDGIAVVVNPGNTTDDLTVDQIKGIYTGELTTWADVQ